MENNWSVDAEWDEVVSADGYDNEYTYADGHDDGLSASGKVGFWARNRSKTANAESTAIHTAEKMQSTGIAQSHSLKAAAYSKKLVRDGINPQVAHEAAIGKAVMIQTASKKKKAADHPKATIQDAISILQSLL